jgi:hypothetical protein
MVEQEGVGNMGFELTMTSSKTLQGVREFIVHYNRL